ncbi:MAG: copper resistance protein [Bryobacterales bacterium]|nr:copper resistance protein [Bryobacterales bacterium]
MAQFLDLFGYLSVLLRAAALSLGAIALGGVVFTFVVRPGPALPASGRRLLFLSAFALAATQVFYVLMNSIILSATTGLRWNELIGASYFIWGCASASAALALGILSTIPASGVQVGQLACSLVILAATIATSHAAARLEHQPILIAATAVHQFAAAAWIGGLPYLLLTLRKYTTPPEAAAICKRFSGLALTSVILLFGAGLALSTYYIGAPAALYGTTYGIMVAAKTLLFGMILTLGAFNFRLVRDRGQDGSGWLKWLSRISEAEIGIGITVILAAASLTSQPPAIDLTNNLVRLPTIAERVAPRLPRMGTPPLASLSPSTRELWKKEHPPSSSNTQAYIPGQEDYVPPTEGDIAWSEYNHHWAGLVVFVMGILAVLSRYRWFTWARHWPVAFVGLAVFLLLRADPENWPLGPSGFWESFSSSDVAQHRLFVLLIVLFAAFEWGVQTHQLKAPKAALVFPAVCTAGGALLLTHVHAVTNLQEELLAELSHTPLALLGVAAGWARWLELRFPGPARQMAARIWPVCFALVGVVLLLYREA